MLKQDKVNDFNLFWKSDSLKKNKEDPSSANDLFHTCDLLRM